jgi:tetratricopeptide (TPR) repeat protein
MFSVFSACGLNRFLTVVLLLGSMLCLSTQTLSAATADEYYRAGLSLFQQKQFKQSADYLKAAVQLEPSHWQAYQALGNSQYQSGQVPEAIASYEKALLLNPNNPPLRNFLETLKSQQNLVTQNPLGTNATPTPIASSKKPERVFVQAGVRMALMPGATKMKYKVRPTDRPDVDWASYSGFSTELFGRLHYAFNPKISVALGLEQWSVPDKNFTLTPITAGVFYHKDKSKLKFSCGFNVVLGGKPRSKYIHRIKYRFEHPFSLPDRVYSSYSVGKLYALDATANIQFGLVSHLALCINGGLRYGSPAVIEESYTIISPSYIDRVDSLAIDPMAVYLGIGLKFGL